MMPDNTVSHDVTDGGHSTYCEGRLGDENTGTRYRNTQHAQPCAAGRVCSMRLFERVPSTQAGAQLLLALKHGMASMEIDKAPTVN